MDPNFFLAPNQDVLGGQSYVNMAYFSGIFPSATDEKDYLNSLDSDTRAYVINHTDEFRSMGDIIDCVNRLHRH